MKGTYMGLELRSRSGPGRDVRAAHLWVTSGAMGHMHVSGRKNREDKEAVQGWACGGQTSPFSSYLSRGLPTSPSGARSSHILWRKELLRMSISVLLGMSLSSPSVPRFQQMTVFLINDHADKLQRFSLDCPLLGSQPPPLSFPGVSTTSKGWINLITRHDGTVETRRQLEEGRVGWSEEEARQGSEAGAMVEGRSLRCLSPWEKRPPLMWCPYMPGMVAGVI